jgi:hypothetical protein
MAAAGNGEAAPPQQEPAPAEAETSGGGVIAQLKEQWRKTKEHAETYPYVWGSYCPTSSSTAAWAPTSPGAGESSAHRGPRTSPEARGRRGVAGCLRLRFYYCSDTSLAATAGGWARQACRWLMTE